MMIVTMVTLKDDEVLNDLLGYEGLKIIQHPKMLNFSLDSILCANFVPLTKKTQTIMDFGTGFAPIPLFLSQHTQAKIIGVDIQEDVIDIARRNVILNQLEGQIDILHEDIKKLPTLFKPSSIDIITCNPPFFKYNETSNINESHYKVIARHEVAIDLEAIIKTARNLLKSKGHFVLVHRTERLQEIIALLEAYRFTVKRLRFIHTKEDKPSTMVLIDATNNGQAGLKVLPALVVHDNEGNYNDEVKHMFSNQRR